MQQDERRHQMDDDSAQRADEDRPPQGSPGIRLLANPRRVRRA